MLDAKVGHQLSIAFISKLCSIVDDYYHGYPESDHNVFLEELYAVLRGDVGQWFSFDPLCEIVHGYN